ncbi:MAG: hypothetical protein HDR45_05740 [Bacteroides sp.]|nr:hypothetical protein [Bacteroidales bacterium]MBD5326437.1 hypothetical protein [Bacteroides sp.]MBD5327383.1 hypothetical protein [Bacteroides sp.]MBD5425681.1 hypothetical protein [Bacteroides sp.]MDE6818658.1 hypothetical protein [Muribaculaceae bacterium]
MRKAIILDTSILCVWLRVPGKETCGPDGNRWTFDSVKQKIDSEIKAGSTLIMPLTSIIETGNHIAQAHGDKHDVVNSFVEHIENAIDGNVPWAAFTEQSGLIDSEALKKTLSAWKETALAGQSFGDALIVAVAKYYAAYNITVEIFTGDMGLKAYEPAAPKGPQPRRRK